MMITRIVSGQQLQKLTKPLAYVRGSESRTAGQSAYRSDSDRKSTCLKPVLQNARVFAARATILAADEAGCFAAWQTTKNDGLPHGGLRHPDKVPGEGALCYVEE
jgi:hypothetical protein